MYRLASVLTVCVSLGAVSCATANLESLNRAPLVERGFIGNKLVEEWHAFPHPTDDRSYANVFRMGNGRVIALYLWPLSTNGVHQGDKLAVADLTDPSQPAWLQHRDIGEGNLQHIELAQNYAYRLEFVSRGGELFAVLTDGTGTNAVVSVPSLHRWRVLGAALDLHLGSVSYRGRYADTGKAGSGVMLFSEKARAAALDPATTWRELLPTYYCILREQDGRARDPVLIGGSGYRFVVRDGRHVVELAK